MICPYCKNKIPDYSDKCFVCGEDLRPKNVSEYYTDMDSVKEVDEDLYKKINKERGTDDDAMSAGQKRAIVVTIIIAVFLLGIVLDIFKYIQYKASPGFEEKTGIVVGINLIALDRSKDDGLTTDCTVAYEYNESSATGTVKAGFNYHIGDRITVFVDAEGNPYHFTFSVGDLIQVILILCFTSLTLIAISRWHKGPNADGHLDKRLPGYSMGSRMHTPKDKKWWRYY